MMRSLYSGVAGLKTHQTKMDEKAKNLMNKDYVTSLLQFVNRIDDIRGNDHRTLIKATT